MRMVVTCMLAHGASEFIKERLYKVSDPFSTYICMNPKCGNIIAAPGHCHVCDNDNIALTNIPYATKLLSQECEAMGLKMVLHPEK